MRATRVKLANQCLRGMAATLSLSALNAADDAFNKRIPVPPNGKIIVDVDFGSIEVVSQPINEVATEVNRSVTMKKTSAESEFLAASPITVTEDGGTITLRARKSGKVKMPSWSSVSKMQAP